MNKRLLQLLGILLIFLFLAACSNEEDETTTNIVTSTNETGDTEEVPEDEVRITISLGEGSQFINEQQLEIEEGANLLEVLRNTFFVDTDDNGEIMTIERQQASEEEGTSWKLYVDGELTDTPAKEYSLEGGEKIVFDLH